MSEHNLQTAVFIWANSGYMLDIFPELSMMFAIPNGGHRDVRVAQKLKQEGVKAGVPDICLPVARGGYHGLFIEMKYGRNKPTADQENYLQFLASQGYLCAVCYSTDEFEGLVWAYMAGMLKAGGAKP